MKKLLVVDDNNLNLKVAFRMLKGFNFDVDTAKSGFECLNLINEDINRYDAIFMDIMMPSMDGVETFHRLKEIIGFKTPVIALTADAMEGSRERYLKEGFDDYLSKPISKLSLEETLNKFVNLNVIMQEEVQEYKDAYDRNSDREEMDII